MSRNRFDDEFTMHVISSASMQILGSNTLASFRNFFNDEIQLSGDWRVALSEIIFPTKIEHVVNEDLIAYSLRRYEDSQKTSSDANVISQPYNGEKISFVTGKFDNVNQLLDTIKRTVGLPNFSFQEIKSTRKYKIILVNLKSLFLVRKYLAVWALQESQMDAVYTFVTKWVELYQITK